MIIDPGLLNHINHRVNDGEPLEAIRQSLIASGWDPAHVQAACDEVSDARTHTTTSTKSNPAIFMPHRRLYEDRSAIDGRLSATQYLTGLLILMAGNVIVLSALAHGYLVLPHTTGINTLFFTASLGVALITIFVLISLCARRLHDLGRSNAWMMCLLVPGINILFLLILCLPGERGTNAYGDDPRAFTIVRMLLNRP